MIVSPSSRSSDRQTRERVRTRRPPPAMAVGAWRSGHGGIRPWRYYRLLAVLRTAGSELLIASDHPPISCRGDHESGGPLNRTGNIHAYQSPIKHGYQCPWAQVNNKQNRIYERKLVLHHHHHHHHLTAEKNDEKNLDDSVKAEIGM